MYIRNYTNWLFIELKINLFAPYPPIGGSKLIFTSPFRDGAKRENQIATSFTKTDIHNIFL